MHEALGYAPSTGIKRKKMEVQLGPQVRIQGYDGVGLTHS
jgi:hypothetical protein